MQVALALLVALGGHGTHRGPHPAAPADGPSAGPGYALAAPLSLEAVVDEATPVPELMRLSGVPGLTIRVVPRGNMLGPEVLAVVRRLPAPALKLRAPLTRAHVEQVEKLKGVPVELELGTFASDPATLALLGQLGPRQMVFQVDASAALPPQSMHLPRGTVRVFFGLRVPTPEELQALAALPDAVVELSAEIPVAAVQAAVDAGLPISVVALDDRIPAETMQVLSRSRGPVKVELSGQAGLSDASRLAAIPALRALAFRFDLHPVLPPDAADRLRRVRPPPLANP